MRLHYQERERLKRSLDVVFAAATILLLLPIAGLIALVLILEGRGPVLFRQERLGRDRRPFEILKFRTMDVDAERDTGPVWAAARDPRVTPVGRFLRASHLDELPQLWNVLRGEMSLVGPRPERGHFVAQYEALVPGYGDRFRATPGITGLSQIRSGYDESISTVRRKIRYDRFYVRRSCVLLDLWLLMGTIGHVSRFGGHRTLASASSRVRFAPPSPAVRQAGARVLRFTAFFAAGAIIAVAALRVQASPGTSLPREGIGVDSPASPRAIAPAKIPWPGGAALLQSAGLDTELDLSADTEPAGREWKENGSRQSWDRYSLSEPGRDRSVRDWDRGKRYRDDWDRGKTGKEKREKRRKDKGGGLVEEPGPLVPVPEPIPMPEPPPELIREPEPEPAAAWPVPEPSSALLVVGGLFWLCRRPAGRAANVAPLRLREGKDEPLEHALEKRRRARDRGRDVAVREPRPALPRGPIRDARDRDRRKAERGRHRGLGAGRHANGVGSEPLEQDDFGRRLVRGTEHHAQNPAFHPNTRVHRSARGLRHQLLAVDGSRGEPARAFGERGKRGRSIGHRGPKRNADRRPPLEAHLVLDQHEGPGRHPRGDAARSIGQNERFGAERGEEADHSRHFLRRQPFVHVRAPLRGDDRASRPPSDQ